MVINVVPVVVLGTPVVTAGGVVLFVEKYTSYPAGGLTVGAFHKIATPDVVVPVVLSAVGAGQLTALHFINLVRAVFCAAQEASAWK